MTYANIKKLGRPLRVLHIGNIANNAYKNALVLRRHGVEADVLCYDYYHIMGCPEWEDGEFKGEVDDFFPDWFATNLKGWSRPDWFVQGPATACLQLLRARRAKVRVTSWLLRRYLEARYWQLVEEDARAKSLKRGGKPLSYIAVQWLIQAMGLDDEPDHGDGERLKRHPLKAGMPAELEAATPELAAEACQATPLTATDPQLDVIVAQVAAEASKVSYTYRDIVAASLRLPYGMLFDAAIKQAILERRYNQPIVKLWLRRKGFNTPAQLEALRAQLSGKGSNLSNHAAIVRTYWRDINKSVLKERILFRLFDFAKPVVYRLSSGVRTKLGSLVPAAQWDERFEAFVARRDVLMATAQSFPKDEVTRLECYANTHPLRFFDVLKSYDVIQGYSTDGFIPWINGVDDFASYEHGTVRDIPWEPTLLGAVCKTVYQHSPLVFITNSDVLPSVDRLGIDRDRRFYIPHGFDDTKLTSWKAANPDLSRPRDYLHVFCPARQHWKTGSPTWRKGNDIMVRAIAEMQGKGHSIRATFVEWGAEVAETKALIEQLGISGICEWVRPKRKAELWKAYCEAHVVGDQFIMPAIGAVTYEVMALGRRVITRIDAEQLRDFFGEEPPLLAAETVADVVAALEKVADDPEDRAGIGKRCSDWIEKYHSTDRIADMHLNAYDELIGKKLLAEQSI